jgi:hypothetical protein
MHKQSYLLPKLPGDPVVVLRMFVADGLKRRQVRLEPGVEGRFVKMEEVGMPSIDLIDQMGLGAYDTPRYIVTFPQGPVYLTEADFQFKYVERPLGERNLMRGPTPGATPDEQKARRNEIQNLRRIDRLNRLNPRYAQEFNMSLYQQVHRIASQHPETRVHLVPILRKYACECDEGLMADGDELMGGRTWGNPDPHSKPDDNVPYRHWEDSPPAGADGSAQRKKYNEWYRNNVCPDKHRTNCGAPWLAK